MKKILIIRFSSFGDVLQCLSVAGNLGSFFPHAEIHWVTRVEFIPLVENHPRIKKVWGVTRDRGWSGLYGLIKKLQQEKYDGIYDAHNNLRSRILTCFLLGFLRWKQWVGKIKFIRRPSYRFKRFFLFSLRWNFYRQPFNGQRDLLLPLKKWGIDEKAPSVPQLYFSRDDYFPGSSFVRIDSFKDSEAYKVWCDFTSEDFREGCVETSPAAERQKNSQERPLIALAPSAAYPLKRWPLEYWKQLIELCSDFRFVILGGPGDGFLLELVKVAPQRVLSLVGHLSLKESAKVVQYCHFLVSNDTGLLHVAEQLGKPCVALMGPAPFGFPSRPSTTILQIDLPCRPCSKHGQGPCVNKVYKKCLFDIRPEKVQHVLEKNFAASKNADAGISTQI